MPQNLRKLTVSAARRYALGAQALAASPRSRYHTRADIARTVEKMGVLQIDSVNILARAQLLPLYSRLGSYDAGLLTAATSKAPRLLLEQWGHEACYVTGPVHRKLAAFRRGGGAKQRISLHPGAAPLTERILAELTRAGAATARELSERLAGQQLTEAERELFTGDFGSNWQPGSVKTLLEMLFDDDIVSSAGRTAHFHRRYDLIERVLPPAVRTISPPDPAVAIAELTRASVAAIGIGGRDAIADVYRLPSQAVAAELARMLAAGTVTQVQIGDSARPYYLADALALPRRAANVTFLSPFDPLIFHRRRALELFGLDYRIGIYTPKAKRTRGYYSLPLLIGEEIVARADLALDRKTATLQVRGAWDELGGNLPESQVAVVAWKELERLAQWLGARDIIITDDAVGSAISRWRDN